jgi:hypothetical protein
VDAGITQAFSEELGEENSITLLPSTFDDLGPELCERVLARLKGHRNAKHTERVEKAFRFDTKGIESPQSLVLYHAPT